ncbi:hypothetical protein ACFLSQ_07380 [Bacteroidota bacterium]
MKVLSGSLALFIILFCFACSDNSTDTDNNFNISIDPVNAEVPVKVEYSADKTGDGKFNKIIITSNDGETTIINPELPWSTTLDIDEGIDVSIKASGTLSNGYVYIKMVGSGSEGGQTQSIEDSTATSRY